MLTTSGPSRWLACSTNQGSACSPDSACSAAASAACCKRSASIILNVCSNCFRVYEGLVRAVAGFDEYGGRGREQSGDNTGGREESREACSITDAPDQEPPQDELH